MISLLAAKRRVALDSTLVYWHRFFFFFFENSPQKKILDTSLSNLDNLGKVEKKFFGRAASSWNDFLKYNIFVDAEKWKNFK